MNVPFVWQHVRRVVTLSGLVVPFLGCGGASKTAEASRTPTPVSPAASAAASAPAPSSSAGAPSETATLCDRVCSFQLRCGDTRGGCTQRCRPVERVLMRAVLESMVTCVESKSPRQCTPEADEERRRLVGECTVEATSGRQEESRANIELFAQTYCKRSTQCGVDGTFNMANCLGSARGGIMATQGGGAGGLYGSLRTEARDQIVTCLQSECSTRRPSADLDLERCLDLTLAAARREGNEP